MEPYPKSEYQIMLIIDRKQDGMIFFLDDRPVPFRIQDRDHVFTFILEKIVPRTVLDFPADSAALKTYHSVLEMKVLATLNSERNLTNAIRSQSRRFRMKKLYKAIKNMYQLLEDVYLY